MRPSDTLPDTQPASRPKDGRQVLIVDASEEARQVLRTVLERRGVRILEAGQAEQGLAMAQACHPHVIVLDTDSFRATETHWQQHFVQHSSDDRTALVLLGKARLHAESRTQRCFAKPYHYGPLVRTIEELLADAAGMPTDQRR